MRSRRCGVFAGPYDCGIFQHFAVADSDAPMTLAYGCEEQYDLLTCVVGCLQADGYANLTVHCANSDAQLQHWNGGGYDPRRHYPVWLDPQRDAALPGAAAPPFLCIVSSLL